MARGDICPKSLTLLRVGSVALRINSGSCSLKSKSRRIGREKKNPISIDEMKQ